MKKLLTFFLQWIAFGFGLLIILFWAYNVLSWTSIDNSWIDNNIKAGTWDVLTVDKWNGLVQKVSEITVDNSGRVWVWQTTPTAKMDVNGIVRSSTWGFKFPDGTVQTTAVTSSGAPSLSIWSCVNVAIWEHESWAVCDTANNYVATWAYQYIKDNGHIKLIYVKCCQITISN